MHPLTRSLYPRDWAHISRRVISERGERGDHCERCGRARRPGTVLTVHHRDGNPSNCVDENLVVLCQGCHLAIQGRGLGPYIRRRLGQLPLWDD